MLGELLEKLSELFSDGGDGGYDHNGHDAIMGGMEYSGIDLSAYSPGEIEEALKSAFGTDGGGKLHRNGETVSLESSPSRRNPTGILLHPQSSLDSPESSYPSSG